MPSPGGSLGGAPLPGGGSQGGPPPDDHMGDGGGDGPMTPPGGAPAALSSCAWQVASNVGCAGLLSPPLSTRA